MSAEVYLPWFSGSTASIGLISKFFSNDKTCLDFKIIAESAKGAPTTKSL